MLDPFERSKPDSLQGAMFRKEPINVEIALETPRTSPWKQLMRNFTGPHGVPILPTKQVPVEKMFFEPMVNGFHRHVNRKNAHDGFRQLICTLIIDVTHIPLLHYVSPSP